MPLTKPLLNLLQKRAEVIAEQEKQTTKLRAKLAALQNELDAANAPFAIKLEELRVKIIETAELAQEEVFSDKASHTHAGQKLACSTSSSVQIDDEEESIVSLEGVKGSDKDFAQSLIKVETSILKNVVKSAWKDRAEFLLQHGINVCSNVNITLKDA